MKHSLWRAFIGALCLSISVLNIETAPLSFEFDYHLSIAENQKPARGMRGLLIPLSSGGAARTITAFGLQTLRRPKFNTVIFLYPSLSEDQGIILPTNEMFLTAFGAFPVDTELREALLAESGFFKTEVFSPLNEKDVKAQMDFFHYVTKKRRKKLKILPMGVSANDLEITKDYAYDIKEVLRLLKRRHERVFVLMAANLTNGWKFDGVGKVDSNILMWLEGLSGDNFLDFLDWIKSQKDKETIKKLPHVATLLTGIFLMDRFLLSHGETLMYGNTGHFPMAKKKDRQFPSGMASMGFHYKPPRSLKIPKDRSRRIAKKLSGDLLEGLTVSARNAVKHRLDPAQESAKPIDYKQAQAKYPVFVSLYKDARVVSQSGSVKAQGPLEESVKHHAIRTALYPVSRQAIKLEEIGSLVIGLSIPCKPEKVEPREVLANRDGVILECRNRKKMFLHTKWRLYPHRMAFLAELASDAGLPSWGWKLKGADLYAFQTVNFVEGEEAKKKEGESKQSEVDLYSIGF